MVIRILAMSLLGFSSLSLAAGNDDLWEITTKMEMAGMPTMPAQTSKVCTPKGQANENSIPHDENCKVQDFKQAGNKRTFKMVCTGENPMTGTGEFVTDSPTAYHGTMRLQGKADGESIDMTNTFSSKRIDSCTYEDVGKKAKAMADANTAAACRGQFESLTWQMFSGKDAQEYCKPYKKEFCGHVAKVSSDMRDPEVFSKYQNRDWKGAMSACGQESEPVMKEACSRAVSGNNWSFVGSNCPAEAEALAKQHCEGRDYTAMRSSPYAGLCSQYASTSRNNGAKSGGLVDSLSKQTGTSSDTANQALEAGKKALKGLLSF